MADWQQRGEEIRVFPGSRSLLCVEVAPIKAFRNRVLWIVRDEKYAQSVKRDFDQWEEGGMNLFVGRLSLLPSRKCFVL